MVALKALIIGLGSMGTRRLRLIKENYPNITIIGIDSNEDRRLKVEKDYKILTYTNITQAFQNVKPDFVIVSTSPLNHAAIISEILEFNIDVFTELNLISDGYEEIIEKAINKNKILFLSSTMLYRNEIDFIKQKINNLSENVNYTYHVGQYLPDWHPWENFKNFFVADKRTNGCREIFAVQLPWLINVFGKIQSLHVVKNKISKIEIDYNDSYLVLLEHVSGHKGSVCFDIVCRKPTTHLEIYSENLFMQWEGTPDSLQEYNFGTKSMQKVETYSSINQNNDYAKHIIENAYLLELDMFLKSIASRCNLSRYSFTDDIYTLKLIDKIENEIIS
jgi:predicted dehydrogenase